MSTAFTWTIKKLTCFPVVNGQSNVVHQAEWQCVGVHQQNGTSYTEKVGGLAGVPGYELGGVFINYEALTEAQVLDWIWERSVSKEIIESDILARIQAQINPPLVILDLPWSVTRV